jgi:hypothetical protein
VAVGSVCTFDTTLVSTFYSNWNPSMGVCSGSRISMYILYNLGKYINVLTKVVSNVHTDPAATTDPHRLIPVTVKCTYQGCIKCTY